MNISPEMKGNRLRDEADAAIASFAFALVKASFACDFTRA